MRILNRPMFRYGGPIKEGVMHGMRNNYQSGQLVQPGPGRPGYQGLDPRKGAVKKAGIWAASKVPGFTKGWLQRMYNKYKFPSKYQSTGQLYKKPFKGRLGAVPKMERAGAYVGKHPYLSTLGPAYLGLTDPVKKGITGIAKGVAGAIPEVAQFATEALTPKSMEKYLPPDKWWKWGGEKWKPGDVRGEGEPTAAEIELAKLKKQIADQQKDGMPDPDKVIDPDAAARLAKDAQNKRLKSYLDMMGYDQAKKGALSKALIDASAIVQQGTEEAGSLKEANWGKLINQAIQTTSKRLDKPEQIREAVGLMSVKAAIEKDLEDPQVKKLRALQIEDAEEKLNTGFEKDMAAFILARKDAPDKSQIERFARLKADEYDLKFTMIADKVIEKIPEDATEKERMEIAGIVDDGIYMIGSDIIRVKDKKIKQIA